MALYGIDIQVAVAIIIENRPARARHLHEVFLAGHPIDMDKVETAAWGYIFKERSTGGGVGR
jgi:hypothetical protein